jgi:hypothetical protein
MAKGTNKNLQNTMHRKLIIEQREHIITGDELMCSQITLKYLGAIKPKGINKIAKTG